MYTHNVEKKLQVIRKICRDFFYFIGEHLSAEEKKNKQTYTPRRQYDIGNVVRS